MCILLVFLKYVYHDARFRVCKLSQCVICHCTTFHRLWFQYFINHHHHTKSSRKYSLDHYIVILHCKKIYVYIYIYMYIYIYIYIYNVTNA